MRYFRSTKPNRYFSTFIMLFGFLTAAYTTPLIAAPFRHIDEQLLEAEQTLSSLGYWILSVDGKLDASTQHAIMAFQKVERLKRTGVLSSAMMEHMRFASRPEARFNTGNAHIEVDISRQVLFLTDAPGIVVRILPVSTGNETRYFDQGKWQIAHTPRGEFRITRQIKGVRHAPLGNLYYPNYFHGGVAIHGSTSIPARAASHGCVRIPMFAYKDFSAMVWVGMEVFVYD
jgi:lipoprotein-anchoring transpeptidase ErfK/SrfK